MLCMVFWSLVAFTVWHMASFAKEMRMIYRENRMKAESKWPEFSPQPFVTKFEPKPRVCDIVATFDDAVSAESRRIEELHNKIEPLYQAFQHLIEMRSPMLSAAKKDSPRSMSFNITKLAVSKNRPGEIRLDLRNHQLSIEYDRGYYRLWWVMGFNAGMPKFADWHETYNHVISMIAPYVVSTEDQ